eukprot:SAG31_NODE_27558_length_424_cov_0.710769_1_plen_42_part_10
MDDLEAMLLMAYSEEPEHVAAREENERKQLQEEAANKVAALT